MARFADINVSQGSVATYASDDGIFNIHLTANLPINLPVKKNYKSVKIWQNYDRKSVARFFGHPVDFAAPIMRQWMSKHFADLRRRGRQVDWCWHALWNSWQRRRWAWATSWRWTPTWPSAANCLLQLSSAPAPTRHLLCTPPPRHAMAHTDARTDGRTPDRYIELLRQRQQVSKHTATPYRVELSWVGLGYLYNFTFLRLTANISPTAGNF